MKDKDLPNDYESSSLEELTLEANKIIEDLESQKDLQNSIEKYQNLIKLNNIIEKKFKKKVTDINSTTKDNISSQRLLEKLGLQYKGTTKLPNDSEELLIYLLEK